MAAEWVVVLEAVGDAGTPRFGPEQLHRLLRAVGDARPVALYCADRYALQLVVPAAEAADALATAIRRWTEGVRRAGLAAWPLARAEVIAPEEFARELRDDGVPKPAEPRARSGSDAAELEGHRLLRGAFHDPLTDLANIELFCHHLAQLASPVDATGAAVLRWDLDAFGALETKLGPVVADAVLVGVAERVGNLVRPEDVLARVGPDEFGLLIEGASRDGALAVAARVLDSLDSASLGIAPDVTVTASMGIAVNDGAEGGEELMARAGRALSAAKAAGGATWRLDGTNHGPAPRRPVPGSTPLEEGLAPSAAVMSVDAEGRILSWHGAAEKTFGHQATEAVGQLLRHLVGSSDQEAVELAVSRALSGSRPRLFGVRGRRPGEPGTFPMELRLVAWHTHGRPFVAVLAHDLTSGQAVDGDAARRDAEFRELVASTTWIVGARGPQRPTVQPRR